MKGLRYLLLVMVAVASIGNSIAEEAAPADVRILIDVSGSMERNDPNNLRQSALQLLVNLIPAGSQGGLWTFGQWVNMVIKPTPVDQAWRDQAIAASKQISSRGLYTNIGGALDNASYDFGYSYFDAGQRPTSVILLTDGKVDIDKNPAVDAGERERILDDVLQKYVSVGVKIHTVALSDDADRALLQTLSERTSGQFSVANTADELSRIFLRTLDSIAPVTEVAINNNQFVIDASINEFTALVFRAADAQPTLLIDPAGQVINALDLPSNIRWYEGGDYDLITVNDPKQGAWQINAAEDSANRVSIVSNLEMRVTGLAQNLIQYRAVDFTVDVVQQGETVTDNDFLSLLQVSAVAVDSVSGERQYLSPSSQQDGQYFFSFSPTLSGTVDVQFDVSAQTFDRRQTATVEIEPLISMERQFDDSKAELLVTIVPLSDELDIASLGIDVTVMPSLASAGSLDVVNGVITWRGVLGKQSNYEIDAIVSGRFVDGYAFAAALPTIQQVSPGLPVEVVKPIAKAPKGEEGLFGLTKKHTIYAAVGLANLLLLVLAVWAYRKFIAKAPAEDSESSEEGDDVSVEVEAPSVSAVPVEQEIEDDVVSLDDIQAVDIQEDAADSQAREAIDEILDDDELYEPLEEERVDELLSEARADLDQEMTIEDEAAEAQDQVQDIVTEDVDVVDVQPPEAFDDALSEDEADALWDEEATAQVAAADAAVADLDTDDIPELNDVVEEEALQEKVAERSVFDDLGDDLDDLSLTGEPFKPAEEKIKVTDFSALDDAELDAALDDILSSVGVTEAELTDLGPIEDADEMVLIDPDDALEDQLSSDLDASSEDALLSLDDEEDLELGDLDDLLNDLDALDESKDDKK